MGGVKRGRVRVAWACQGGTLKARYQSGAEQREGTREDEDGRGETELRQNTAAAARPEIGPALQAPPTFLSRGGCLLEGPTFLPSLACRERVLACCVLGACW